MTKKKEKEEDVIEAQDAEKEAEKEIGQIEGEEEAEMIDKKVHAELIKTAENCLNSWKRCQADFENYKKDQAKVMEEFRKFANLNMVFQILPAIDNFNSALEHVPQNQRKSPWVEGIIYIKKQLEDVLKNNGVSEIDVKEGDEFNPAFHEAVKSDSNDANEHPNDSNVIKKVVQKGYQIDGKVVRPARVIV